MIKKADSDRLPSAAELELTHVLERKI